jgi:shikimate kinase
VIVEFVGASGSGKTTLTHDVARQLNGFGDVITASDLVLSRWKLQKVTHPTARNVIADMTSAVDAPRLRRSERAFLRYAFRRLSMHRSFDLQTLNYCRSIIRRTGMDVHARRVGSTRIVLADEGIVLTAYLLFAYGECGYEDDDLAEFAEMVPLPDLIVHVKAPLESLTRRAASRVDRRRELSVDDRYTVQRRLYEAAELFDRLVAVPEIGNRVIAVENLDCLDAQRDAAAVIAKDLRNLLLRTGSFSRHETTSQST